MTETARTAAEAFDRYEAYLKDGRLIQSTWRSNGGGSDQDGRDLACGLGVLGPNVNSPIDCPSAVMPHWLAQMIPWLFDNQDAEDAFAWGERFYGELKRLDGIVPFSVVHDWQANVVQPMGLEWAEKRKQDKTLIEAAQKLHLRALTGDTVAKAEWVAVLKPAYKQVYLFKYAYAYAYAYANAYARARAYANANANADANAYANAYANANADAYANAKADAYANAKADAYANAYAYANANADAYANANAKADAYANAYAYANADAYRKYIKRLADGLVECLARVQP